MGTWQQNATHVCSVHVHLSIINPIIRRPRHKVYRCGQHSSPRVMLPLLLDPAAGRRSAVSPGNVCIGTPGRGGAPAALMATCQKLSQIVEISQNWGDYPDGAAQDRVGVLSSDGGPTGNHCVTKVSISLIENVEECEMKIDENKSLISVRCSAPPWHPAPMLSPDMRPLTDCPLSNVNNMKGVSENVDTTAFCRPLLYG